MESIGARVKAIFTDLDNTLLRSERYISAYSQAILEECQKKGIKIAFATARSNRAAARFLGQFSPEIFIGYGGALVQAGEEIIYREAIPADVSYNLISDCQHEPEITAVLAINETVAYANTADYKSLDSESSHYRHVDFSSVTMSYLKISVVCPNPSVVERVAVRYPQCDMLRYSGEDLYRFSHIDAVKWKAVEAVLGYYQIGRDEYVAFGDDSNDLEMVANCPNGVAVANALAEVKEAAKHICASNDEDGVAKWIADNILRDNSALA
jgi:Cof subfamily protein (haloacid dehalogenase superfamily)